MVFSLLITAILAIIAAKTLKEYLKRRHSNIPSANMGWPFIGETLSFVKAHPAFTLGDYLQHHIAKYGTVFWANIFGKWVIHSVDPELNRFVVNNEMKMFKQGWPRSLSRLIGNNALTISLGDAHKRRRAEVLNYLSGSRLESTFLRDMEQIASAHMESWRNREMVIATDETRKYAFYMIAKKALSMTPGSPETEKLMEALNDIYMGIGLIYVNLPGTRFRKALQSRAYVQEVIRQKLEQRRLKDQEDDDFLNYLIKDGTYSTEEMGDLVQNFIFGGNEVIGRTLAAAIYYLGTCPQACDQLREERLQVIRSKQQSGDSSLTLSDYRGMEFTQCVVNETLRLGTVSRFLHKVATANIQYKGYVIPRGCTVIANISAMHLDPTEFKDPETFNPWRWLTPNGVKKSRSFMPFSGGARHCIGAELAKLELMVFIHQLVTKYEWEFAQNDPPMATPRLEFPNCLPIKIKAISPKL
ncbi:steroid 22-alpha-hydroxylase protein [Dioscorea alata]|uniref:Steroid 22-alpha-hydroxylase protein n=1 Tax=Dioscorea alata TaxID=55571 RepID=A0ACB7WGR3_DIOAL|nr:steroid 22-alpha-hydroxylase protein [Dioscorea alata]